LETEHVKFQQTFQHGTYIGPNILVSTLFSNTPSLCSLNVRNQVSYSVLFLKSPSKLISWTDWKYMCPIQFQSFLVVLYLPACSKVKLKSNGNLYTE
jgi:hypothetical protein